MSRTALAGIAFAILSFTTAHANTLWALAQDGLTIEEHAQWVGNTFSKYDTNSDGAVIGEEFATLWLGLFDQADKDGDGVLRRGEWRGVSGVMGDSAKNGLARQSVSDLAALRFAHLDVNSDGVVIVDEYAARLREQFMRADVNGDSVLRRGELRALAAQ